MALQKLVFKPGVNRDQTDYAGEGGWYSCDRIRFLSGFPQKLGGWVRYSVSAYLGVCRTMFNWLAGPGYNYLALGTSSKIYVESGGTLNDITPIRATFAAGTVSFTTNTTNPTSVLVTTTTVHGAATGDYVVFSGAVAVGGVPAASLNNVQFEITVVNTTTFTITVSPGATSVGTLSVGIIGYFYIATGFGTASSGVGWGAPPWGGFGTTPTTGWGIAATTAISVSLRYVYFATRYNSTTNFTDLLFNVRNGPIYYWAVNTSFQVAPAASPTNAIALTGTSVPAQVGQILYDTNAGILMAFGATAYGAGSTTFDPLLVRWASQDDYTNWDPAAPYTSTAGFLKLQTGSTILRAIPNLNETLVFTESSVTSVQFVGGLDVFAQKLISSEASLIGPNAICVRNNTYYWMGTDKFQIYNGRVETIPCTLRQHVFEDINFSQAEQFLAASNERFFEVWWFYCSANSTVIDKYVVFNYAEDIWYYGTCTDVTNPSMDLSRTAWSDSPLRQYPQGASGASNYIFDHERGCDADTAVMNSYIQSNYTDIQDGDQFMLLRRVIPDVSFAQSTTTSSQPYVNMGVGVTNFPGAAPMTLNQEGEPFSDSVTRTSTAVLDQYTTQVFIRGRGRQMAFRINSDSLGVNWQLGAVRIDVRPDGRRG